MVKWEFILRFFRYNIKLEEDFDRLKALQWMHFSIVMISIFSEIFNGVTGILGGAVEIILLSALYIFLFKTAKELYYSFWSFAFVLFCYLSIGLFEGIFIYDGALFFFLYSLAFIFFGFQLYILSSPIYFPKVSWWVYDFRYRDDLKIYAEVKTENGENDSLPARLTDLRREAGCVTLFKDLEVGKVLSIAPMDELDLFRFTVEIMSKREYCIGRGITYGVKFYLEEESEKEDFKNFAYLWKVDRIVKKRKNYTKEVRV